MRSRGQQEFRTNASMNHVPRGYCHDFDGIPRERRLDRTFNYLPLLMPSGGASIATVPRALPLSSPCITTPYALATIQFPAFKALMVISKGMGIVGIRSLRLAGGRPILQEPLEFFHSKVSLNPRAYAYRTTLT